MAAITNSLVGIEIECCTNDEWLVEYGGYDRDETTERTQPSRAG